MIKPILISFFFLFIINYSFCQTQNLANDTEAASLLQKVSEKYKAYKNISAEFKLVIQRPKLKPNESDSKYTDTLKGKLLLEGSKFNISK